MKTAKCKKHTLTLLCLLIIVNLYSQTNNFRITGIIKDNSETALELATVTLHKAEDRSKTLKTTFTDSAGRFRFLIITAGEYLIRISHAGFANKETGVSVSNKDEELGTIKLISESKNPGAVTVVSKKPVIELANDKLIYNLNGDLQAKAESALDILRRTPMVGVDGNDNVYLNGQTNFKVLLNERETGMFNNNLQNALKSFPGALITKIEIITNPSAKYDAEGIGGIINIITEKKLKGYNASLTAGYHHGQNVLPVSASFSGKFQKLGITLNYSASRVINQPFSNFYETTPLQNAFFTRRLSDSKGIQNNLFQSGNAEISWDIDSMTVLSVYMATVNNWSEAKRDFKIITELANSNPLVSYFSNNGRILQPGYTSGADLVKKGKRIKGAEFTFRINYDPAINKNYLRSDQDNPGIDRYIFNTSIGKNRQLTLQADKLLPLGKNRKLEFGIKTIFRKATSDFESLIKTNPADEYKADPRNTDVFRYHQNVYGAFFSYSFRLSKLNFVLGLRGEHTTINGDFIATGSKVKQDYNAILPNIQVSWKWNTKSTVSLNYNKRLERPFINDLNPFVNNVDTLNINYGNPDLKPQVLHIYTVQNRTILSKGFIGLSFVLQNSNTRIIQYTSFNNVSGVASTTRKNIGREMQFTININLSININPDWNLFANISPRYNRISSLFNKREVNDGWGGNVNINSAYTIKKKFTPAVFAGFFRPPVTIQQDLAANFFYGTRFSYRFLNNKLTITLLLQNISQANLNYRNFIRSESFKTISVGTTPWRRIGFTVAWNFGGLKENVSKKRGINNDDLLN